MFKFVIAEKLDKFLKKISKRDPVLLKNFKKKVAEIVSRDAGTISIYKNLKKPLQHLKMIHLTDETILLFSVDLQNNEIIFVDIKHWKKAY
jgi:mRNA-degrading endonuclease RelE of RelBE toxin-antitoxin system